MPEQKRGIWEQEVLGRREALEGRKETGPFYSHIACHPDSELSKRPYILLEVFIKNLLALLESLIKP